MLEPEARGTMLWERRRVLLFTSLVLLTTACAWPYRSVVVGPVPAFFGACGGIMICIVSLTAAILSMRAGRRHDFRTAIFAGAYTFAAPVIVANVVSNPVVWPGMAVQGAAYTWVFARLGWSLITAVGAWSPQRTYFSMRAITIAALTAAFVCIALALHVLPGSGLPALIKDDHTRTQIFNAFCALIVAVDFLALAGLYYNRAKASFLEVWVAVALIGIIAEVSLLSGSLVRFSIGSYAARVEAVMSSLAVYISLVGDYLRVSQRTVALEKHALLADASPHMTYVTDDRGLCTYANRRWTEATGQQFSASLGLGWRSVVHPDDLASDRTLWERDRRLGLPHQFELRFLMADGKYRWFSVRRIPIRDAARKIVAWLGTAADIDDYRRALADLQESLEREHSVSQTLQSAFLPPFLPDIAGVVFDAAYRPAKTLAQVGGDWYDAFPVRDDCVAFSVGDAMGHGVRAASTMIRVRETIRAAAASLDAEPAAVLSFANRALCNADTDALATALFAVYSPSTGRLVYSCAGHPPPLFRRNGHVEFLPGGGATLGIESDYTFPTHQIDLHVHDLFALYTDGLIENTRDIVRGELHLAEIVADASHSAADIADRILSGGQADDAAILLMRVAAILSSSSHREVEGWRFHSDDPESARPARASFMAYLRRRNLNDDALASFEAVFGELVGNVVRHAPGPIEIDLSWHDHTPTLIVRDRGPGFDLRPDAVALPEDFFKESGRGIFMISAIAGMPEVRRRPGGGCEVIVRCPVQVLSASSK